MLCAAALVLAGAARAEETIVLVRHGEKPDAGLGQLDCQGLNRALKLPAVVEGMFGKPKAILAPDPAKEKDDHGVLYDYVRPLATIEPTAIHFAMPINTKIGVDDVSGLKAELEKSDYHDGVVLVGWEHKIIVDVARDLLSAHGGNPDDVPKWKGDEFDNIYVVKIDWSGGKATFEKRAEGLDGQPKVCPQ
jgi:hypothetical protein